MSRHLCFLLSLALLAGLSVLTACHRPSSNVSTTRPSPTAESATTPTSTTAASPASTEMKTSPSGLQYQDTQIGSGQRPLVMQNIRVAYVGKFLDGHKFDANLAGIDFNLGKGEVVKGWDWGIGGNAKEGIEPMRVGGKRKLIIPPQLGYGDKPNGTIPANATLVFEIELLKVNRSSF
ncbi:MAG: FKBP-type peptidyl-prolyl cis-trans isomerase [Acidobacteriota bacterium]